MKRKTPRPKSYPVLCECGDMLMSQFESDRGRRIDHAEHLKRNNWLGPAKEDQ